MKISVFWKADDTAGFATLLNWSVTYLAIHQRDLAGEFEVSPSSISRWANGAFTSMFLNMSPSSSMRKWDTTRHHDWDTSQRYVSRIRVAKLRWPLPPELDSDVALTRVAEYAPAPSQLALVTSAVAGRSAAGPAPRREFSRPLEKYATRRGSRRGCRASGSRARCASRALRSALQSA